MTIFLAVKLVSAIFLSNFYFSPNDSPSKTTKKFFISSKKLFFSQDIQIFVFLPSRLFFHVSHCFRSWSKKILKVYDVINCLNKKLITHFVWYLDKEIRRDIETLSIERVVNKEYFDGKIMQKMCTKNWITQKRPCMQEILLKIRNFERWWSKSL